MTLAGPRHRSSHTGGPAPRLLLLLQASGAEHRVKSHKDNKQHEGLGDHCTFESVFLLVAEADRDDLSSNNFPSTYTSYLPSDLILIPLRRGLSLESWFESGSPEQAVVEIKGSNNCC